LLLILNLKVVVRVVHQFSCLAVIVTLPLVCNPLRVFLGTTFHKLIVDPQDPHIEKLNLLASAVLNLLDPLVDGVKSSCLALYSVFSECCKYLGLPLLLEELIGLDRQFFLANSSKFVF